MIVKVTVCVFLFSGSLGKPLLPTSKLSVATWGSYHQQDHKGPGTYAFGYDIEDPVTGNIQFRQEERHSNGTVTGNYGFVDSDGKPYIVTYISDENGYRSKIEKEGEPTQYFPSPDLFYNPRSKEETWNNKPFLISKQFLSDNLANEIGGYVLTTNYPVSENNFVYNPDNFYQPTYRFT